MSEEEVVMTPRGGGDEVGASLYPMNIDDQDIAFDCGIRPSGFETDIHPVLIKNRELANFLAEMSVRPRRDKLPNLGSVPQIDRLFLTHGHLDHVGAVPLLARKDRHIIIYATPVTKKLCELHWFETIKIAERNKEVPIFSQSDIEFTLSRIVIVTPGETIKLNDKWSLKPVEAGHILGATSYVIYRHGKPYGFHSGDFSCTHQRTVPGAPELEFESLKFLTIDSTRLTEKNPPREDIETACMDNVYDTYRSGGFSRFLVFSIGRAQEAVALAREACPDAPLWIDGLARQVTAEYANHLNGMFKGIEKHFVLDKTHRSRIIESGEPNIVIVPSAMQFGGHSRKYVEYGCYRKDHLFISLGWIDPCSPEYAFFESGNGDVFQFGANGRSAIMCQKARYNLTAHCDGDDILAVKSRMNPEKVLLVHGDGNKMDQFIDQHPNEGFIKAENNKAIKV